MAAPVLPFTATVTSNRRNKSKKKYSVKWCCSVPGCYESYRKANISMHQYPQNRELCKIWIDACKITKTITKNHRICSDHFFERDFFKFDRVTRRKLYPHAVPSKNLPATVEEALVLQTFRKPRKKLTCSSHLKANIDKRYYNTTSDNMARNQSNSCEKTQFSGNGTSINYCGSANADTKEIVIKSEVTTEDIGNDAEGSINETIIGCAETSVYTATEFNCDETKLDVKDIKLEAQNEDWNKTSSDEYNLKSPSVNVTIKCEPQSNYAFVDVGNIKQEYENSELVSTFTDNDEASHYSEGDFSSPASDFSLPVDKKQFLQCRSVAQKSFQCAVCNKCFPRLHDLNRHKITHTGEKPYQCDVCNKSFSQSGSLTVHKRRHTGEKPYQCDVCNRSFSLPVSLKIHKSQHTGEKPYQCDVCNKCFKGSSNLITHRLIHTGEKMHKCDVCHKYFNRSCHLNRHKLTHAADKPYQCELCNKFFTQSTHLNRHKLTHTGEKPYQCDICNKCFTQSSNLNSHRLTHTGQKPYQCDVCNKCFTDSSNLNRHKYIHSGETPFQCDICNKCFTDVSNLSKHKLVHSSVKQYR